MSTAGSQSRPELQVTITSARSLRTTSFDISSNSFYRWLAGILVPDLCLEETALMRTATKKAGLELTLLVTPTTPQDRMKRIAEASEGFVYLVSLTGLSTWVHKDNSKIIKLPPNAAVPHLKIGDGNRRCDRRACGKSVTGTGTHQLAARGHSRHKVRGSRLWGLGTCPSALLNTGTCQGKTMLLNDHACPAVMMPALRMLAAGTSASQPGMQVSVVRAAMHLQLCPGGCLQAQELRSWGAEGVIVGSALVKALGEAASPQEGLEELARLAESIRAAI